MNSYRRYIEEYCAQMVPGDHFVVEETVFRDAYPISALFFEIYRTSEEKFLSGMIGSSWGAWKVYYDYVQRIYIISHHKCGNKRVYVDPDREHLYKRMPDGTLMHVEEYNDRC